MGQGLIEAGEEMWLYYSGAPLRHNEGTLERIVHGDQPRTYRRAVIRRDRLVSVDAGREGGYVCHPAAAIHRCGLTLNVEIRPGGKVRVGLLDEKGEAGSRAGPWKIACPSLATSSTPWCGGRRGGT